MKEECSSLVSLNKSKLLCYKVEMGTFSFILEGYYNIDSKIQITLLKVYFFMNEFWKYSVTSVTNILVVFFHFIL